MRTDLYQGHDYFNMDDLLTEEHKLIRDTAREWVKQEVSPIIEEAAENCKFPQHLLPGLGEIGAFGPYIPEEYGGANLDFFYEVIFNEEIGRMNSGGFAVTQQSVQYIYFLLLLYELQLGLEYQAYKLVFRFFCTLNNFF